MKKIAAISDIHSNVYALDAVLSDIKSRGVDVVVNLGDILYGPIAPRATYDRLMEHDFVTIRGNQDRQIYEATEMEIQQNPTLQFIIDDLGKEPFEWMQNLPFSVQLTDEVFLCHGTPHSDLIYLLENVESGKPVVRSEDEILSLLKGQSSDVVICGHTHIPRSVTLNNGQLIVNTGSVGLPAYKDDEPGVHSMENYSPHATYVILEQQLSGWTVNTIRVAYNFSQAVEDAKKRNRIDWAWYLSTGRTE